MKKTLMNFIACTNFSPPTSKKDYKKTFCIGEVSEGYYAANIVTNAYLLPNGQQQNINSYPTKNLTGWYKDKNELISLIHKLNYRIQP